MSGPEAVAILERMHHSSFAGKNVLITGASMGLGKAFAEALARQGATVILVARSAERLEALARALPPGKAHVVALDLAAPGAAGRVKAAVAGLGLGVDVLVNNAGFGLHGPFTGRPPEEQREQIDVNVVALVELTGVFAPEIERRRGGIINVASVAGFQPTPYMAVYGATKAFVLSFSDALWAELQPRGVRVLCVSPGVTATGFFERAGEGAAGGLAGKKADPAAVVETALAAYAGDRASVVHGLRNAVTTFATRFLSRQRAALIIAKMTAPKPAIAPAG